MYGRCRRCLNDCAGKSTPGPGAPWWSPPPVPLARMEGMDKILLPLGDVPILIRTLQALENCPLVQEIIVVTRRI